MEVGLVAHEPGADARGDAEIRQLRIPLRAEFEGQDVEVFGLREAVLREEVSIGGGEMPSAVCQTRRVESAACASLMVRKIRASAPFRSGRKRHTRLLTPPCREVDQQARGVFVEDAGGGTCIHFSDSCSIAVSIQRPFDRSR